MEKREPSLVPEWLRSSGQGSGGGSSNNLLSSSSSNSDSPLSHNSKNRNSRIRSDVDSVRSPFLDRSSSTNTGRIFSNGSTRDAYSSFNFSRNQRDKDWSREKDSRLNYMDRWEHEESIPHGTFLIRRDQEQLRRSHSMTTRKPGNHLAQGFNVGVKNGGSMNMYNVDGIFSRTTPVRSSKKPGFDKDFPLLRAEERNGVPDIVSPSRSPVVESLSVGNSALIVGEGWTSALAEVPNVIEKSGAGAHASVGSSATLLGPTSRNMAEALVQAPTRTGTPPQGSVIQRFEDRAIKQSRQLIPVVPSTPKGSVHNSSDKLKTKPVIRSGETGIASFRNTHQQSSVLFGNLHSNPGSQIKPDTTKKLVVLKPTRESGVSAGGSPPNSRAASNQMTAAPSTTASVKSTNNPRELKGGAPVNMIARKPIEKKLSLVQTQSRNAFFSALKQKTTTNMSTDSSKTSSCTFSSVEEKENSSKEVVASDPSSEHAAERDEIMERVESDPKKNNGFESADRPDEKEAEFLKSLGWDENSNEDEEALTEEEIRAFIEQCKKLKPSLVQKLPIIQEPTEDVKPHW